MLVFLQLITLLLLAVTMACSVGHALEFPGKRRLSKEPYFIVQTIYYPGFTLAGIAEFAALPMLLVLLLVTPRDTAAFGLTGGALITQAALQIIFWVVTQPVNKAWVSEIRMGRGGEAFFGTGRGGRPSADWTALRDRWEYSHLARGVLATGGLMLLGAAIASS
jgi:hypothetical protein